MNRPERAKVKVCPYAQPFAPIARAVAADTRVCTAMETLLRELTGLPVEERCNRGEQQGCRFIIKVPRDNKLPLRPRAEGKALK